MIRANIDIENPLKVQSTTDYFKFVMTFDDEDSFEDWFENAEEVGFVDKIIAAEYSILLLRRTAGICGSTIDTLADLRRSLIEEYNDKFDLKFKELNRGLYL